MIGDPGDDGLYGEPRKLGGCTAGLHIMVDDNEAMLRRAAAAGAKEVQPVTGLTDRMTRAATMHPGPGRSLRNAALAFVGHIPRAREAIARTLAELDNR
jgi:2-polyprenyl-6-methoxyphenol hydroxylase-like FAD-dependent oxidoreductase